MSTLLKSEFGQFVRAKLLAARLNCGEPTVWRMVGDGRLPPPSLRLGQRCTLWRWADVEKFLQDKGTQVSTGEK